MFARFFGGGAPGAADGAPPREEEGGGSNADPAAAATPQKDPAVASHISKMDSIIRWVLLHAVHRLSNTIVRRAERTVGRCSGRARSFLTPQILAGPRVKCR